MAQFRGIVQGSRGETSRLGGKNGGLRTVCNGWHLGVEVQAFHENGKDVFKVYKTGGSSHFRSSELIATVTE